MDNESLYAAIGRKAAARRKELRRTQEQVAVQMELSRASIANIEVGRQSLLLHQAYRLADVLGFQTLDELLPTLSVRAAKQSSPKAPPTSGNLTSKQKSEVTAFFNTVVPTKVKKGQSS